MQRDYRDTRDTANSNSNSIAEMSDDEIARIALRLMSQDARTTFTPKELRKYVGENLDKLPSNPSQFVQPVQQQQSVQQQHHYQMQQQQQQQQLYPPQQRHQSQSYHDFPGTIGGNTSSSNGGNNNAGGMSMDAMASELQSYSAMMGDYESSGSGNGLSRSASGNGNSSGQNLWSDFSPLIVPGFSSPPSSPSASPSPSSSSGLGSGSSGSSSPSSPKMALPVAKKSAPVSGNPRQGTGTGTSTNSSGGAGPSSSISSAGQSSMPLKSSQSLSSASPHYPSTPRAQPRTERTDRVERAESAVDHFENLERSIRTDRGERDYYDRANTGVSSSSRDSSSRGNGNNTSGNGNSGFLTHLPDKTRTLQNVLEEIDREFGDCNPELKEKLRQITLLYRPEYQEILQQAFTPKERDSIYKSMQPNHLELYKDLYKTFFDLHRRRSSLTAAVLKNDQSFKPVQDFLQSRQQILGDLLRKYRTILEKSEE